MKNIREKDEKIVIVVEKMKKAEVKILRDEELQIKENLVLKRGKVYVLKNKELRIEII